MRRSLLAGGSLLLALHAPQAVASLIIGNLPAANDNLASSFSIVGSKGIGFTMSDNYHLTSATLRLSIPAGKTPIVQLMSDLGGNPSATLLNFSATTLTTGVQSAVFTPGSAFDLLAGTTYWLVMATDVNTNGIVWLGNGPAQTPTGPGATYAGIRFSPSSFPPSGPSSVINSFQIDGDAFAVPIPSTLTLALLGIALLAPARRKTRA